MFLEEIPELHHRKMLEPSYRWRKRHATFGNSLPKKERGPIVKIQAIQGYSGANIQSNFFSQQILESGHATELYLIRFAKYETAIEEKRLEPGRCDQKQKSPSTPSTLWTKIRTRNTRLTTISSLTTTRYTLWTGAQDNKIKFYQTLNGCVICLETIPRSTSSKSSTKGTQQKAVTQSQ